MARRARNSRRRRRSGGLAWQQVVAGISIFLLLGGLGYLVSEYIKGKGRAGHLDPNTFCPTEGSITKFIVLVDRTDALSPAQRLSLEIELRQIAEAVPVEAAFILYEVGGPTLDGVLSPVSDVMCNPGSGEESNPVFENPKLAREKYEQQYLRRISELIDAMSADQVLDQSPILEAIQAISIREIDSGTEKESRLWVFSDFLQNSEHLSLYSGVPDIERFQDSGGGRALSTNLHELYVNLRIFFRPNDVDLQTDELQKFWLDWIKESYGVVESWAPISG